MCALNKSMASEAFLIWSKSMFLMASLQDDIDFSLSIVSSEGRYVLRLAAALDASYPLLASLKVRVLRQVKQLDVSMKSVVGSGDT